MEDDARLPTLRTTMPDLSYYTLMRSVKREVVRLGTVVVFSVDWITSRLVCGMWGSLSGRLSEGLIA